MRYKILEEGVDRLYSMAMAMVGELSLGQKVKIEVEGDRVLEIWILEEGKAKAYAPGYIRVEKRGIIDGIIGEVVQSQAKKGYGPLLYDLAMEFAVNYMGWGGIMADTSNVSPAARNVWRNYFENRSDVEREELPREMFFGGSERPEYLKYYYYKLGTGYLDKFISLGLVESESANI